MELLLVPVPLFDRFLSAEAYLFRYQLANQAILFSTQKVSPPLEAVREIGAEAFAGNSPILVPVSAMMLEGLLEQRDQTPDTITLYLEDVSTLEQEHLGFIARLRGEGYTFAVLHRRQYIDYPELLRHVSFVVFDEESMAAPDRKVMAIRYGHSYGDIRVVATGLNTMEDFELAKKDSFHLFEGMFFRVPIRQMDHGLTPLKANLIRLLNMVRDDNFEFKDIAVVMRQDTALSYSMIRFINSPYLGIRHQVKSIQQAVTMLGQIEVRKWISAAVVKSLGSDRPNELTRISLVRAKFAENLAGLFGMPEDAPSIFLMGLFSVLDAMLDCSMEKALEQVQVSDDIAEVLIHGGGRYSGMLRYVLDYEKADWASVMQQNMQYGIFTPDIYSAYIGAVGWYNEMLSTKPEQAPRFPHSTRPSMRSDW